LYHCFNARQSQYDGGEKQMPVGTGERNRGETPSLCPHDFREGNLEDFDPSARGDELICGEGSSDVKCETPLRTSPAIWLNGGREFRFSKEKFAPPVFATNIVTIMM
jgi:hypothetical protein